jgi:hypothetical protein
MIMIWLLVYLIGVVLSGWIWFRVLKDDCEYSSYEGTYYEVELLHIVLFGIVAVISWIGFIYGIIHAGDIGMGTTIFKTKPKK